MNYQQTSENNCKIKQTIQKENNTVIDDVKLNIFNKINNVLQQKQ